MKNDCCSSTLTEPSTLERPRYYPRQLITADDLTLEQDYVRDKLRRHNRLLHGWGVVCGAKLDIPQSNPAWKLLVKQGYVLGPFGDEIWIERDVCVDLRTRCYPVDWMDDPCSPCADDSLQPAITGGTVHVAVRYQELRARPVRVQPTGCGCDDSPCEYSRWRDGYEICMLDECPETHENPPSWDDPAGGDLPDCPPLPHDPWVVLGAVTYNDEGKITGVEHCACRRHVASFGQFWWKCQEPGRSEEEPGEARASEGTSPASEARAKKAATKTSKGPSSPG